MGQPTLGCCRHIERFRGLGRDIAFFSVKSMFASAGWTWVLVGVVGVAVTGMAIIG